VHIDSLLDKLREPRVRSIIQPMILGDEGLSADTLLDAMSYTKDLGLIRRDEHYRWIPANPIYAEVIVRTLNYQTQDALKDGTSSLYQMPRYFKDGKIDMDYLLRDFQAFWRENGAIWRKRYEYEEAAPHLVLMAFLQRIINGGGQLIREIAAGTKRLDLCVVYESRKYPIELKILRGQKTEPEGLEQTANYMNSLGCSEGWLLMFYRDMEKSWDEKIFMRAVKHAGKSITVVGC
jgi:hypothetical protein